MREGGSLMSTYRVALSLFAVLAGWACADTGAPAKSGDREVLVEIRDLIQKGKLEDASGKVDRLLAGKYLELGLMAAQAGETPSAVELFRHVLELDPSNERARLELARALYTMGALKESSTEFEAVRRSGPPPSVVANIDTYLDAIKAQRSPWQSSLGVRVGGTHDDNVNFGPVSERVRIRPVDVLSASIEELSVDSSSQPQSSAGLFAQMQVATLYDPQPSGGWQALLSGLYYQTWLERVTDFETAYLSFQAAPRHVSERRIITVPVRVDYVRQGHEPLAIIAGLQPSGEWAVGDTASAGTALRVEYRDYDEADNLDALYTELLQTLRKAWGASRTAGASLALFREDADDDAYSNGGGEASVDVQQLLPWDIQAMVYARLRGEWYDDREPLAPEDRDDREFSTGAELQKAISQRLALFLAYEFTKNSSSFDLYDYERNFWSAGVQGQW